jgi:hypothetical protein
MVLPLPASNLWWREATNSGHTLLFMILSYVVFYQIRSKTHYSNNLIIFFIVLLTGMLLGVVIEMLQGLVHREMSWNDLYKNFFGLMSGLGLAILFHPKNDYQWKKTGIFLVLFSISFLLLGIYPLLQLSWHYIQRDKDFPVIVDFESNWSSSFIRFNKAEIIRKPGNDSKKMFRIRFDQGEFPGVNIIEPEQDWSAYSRLRFSVFSYNKKDVAFLLRVHDKMHNQNYPDRFNQRLTIKPGLNKIVVKLSLIQKGPVNRLLDLSNIAGLTLASVNNEEPLLLDISNIYLE